MDKRVRRTEVPDDLPRSPTGRVPKWVIDEAAGRETTPQPWRAQPEGRGPRRRRLGWWITAAIVVLVIVGLVALQSR